MAAKRRFTRIPKVKDLILAGVPAEAIPTYCALSDYTNNKTGICWPKMETLAATLGRSVRTVQRHLHLLRELGLVEFVERRRWRGRYSGYTYRVLHVVELIRRKKKEGSPTTGHEGPVGKRPPIFTGTRRSKTTPSNSPTEGYEWLFGREAPPGVQEEHDRVVAEGHQEAARRRVEGYWWLFGHESCP